MELENFSPTFREFVRIIESLRDTITGIDEVFTSAIKEVGDVWTKLK